jgi:hypothetical protein
VTASLLEQLADLPKGEVDALIRAMAPGAATAFQCDWRYRARPEQLPPDGSWRVWLLMAGRGLGKTPTKGEPGNPDYQNEDRRKRKYCVVGDRRTHRRRAVVEPTENRLLAYANPSLQPHRINPHQAVGCQRFGHLGPVYVRVPSEAGLPGSRRHPGQRH